MKKLEKVIPFRTAYEPHKPCFFHTEGESLTQQHFQEECDIINIIKDMIETESLNTYIVDKHDTEISLK